MAKMRQYTFREMERIIKMNGYTYIRCSGDHYIYKKEGANEIVIAKKKHVNPCIARRLIKENNLTVAI